MHPFEELYNEISSLIKDHNSERIVLLVSPLVADKLIEIINENNGIVYYANQKIYFQGSKFINSPPALLYLKNRNTGTEFYRKLFQFKMRGDYYLAVGITVPNSLNYELDVVVDPSMGGTKAKPVFLSELTIDK